MKRVAIVGSRNFGKLEKVKAFVASLPKDVTVVSGGARGVDKTAQEAASARGLNTDIFLAKWEKYGHAAGAVRNKVLVDSLVPGRDLLQAFWDGKSRGTKHAIELAIAAGVDTLVEWERK